MAYLAEVGDRSHRVDIHDTGEGIFRIEVDGMPHEVDSRQVSPTTYSLIIDGRSYVAEVTASGEQYAVNIDGTVYRFRVVDERRHTPIVLGAPQEEHGRREIKAQMPGKVIDVLVSVGDLVERDQGLLVIEAMKMENEVKAPAAGEVKEIRVMKGQAVETNELLLVIE